MLSITHIRHILESKCFHNEALLYSVDKKNVYKYSSINISFNFKVTNILPMGLFSWVKKRKYIAEVHYIGIFCLMLKQHIFLLILTSTIKKSPMCGILLILKNNETKFICERELCWKKTFLLRFFLSFSIFFSCCYNLLIFISSVLKRSLILLHYTEYLKSCCYFCTFFCILYYKFTIPSVRGWVFFVKFLIQLGKHLTKHLLWMVSGFRVHTSLNLFVRAQLSNGNKNPGYLKYIFFYTSILCSVRISVLIECGFLKRKRFLEEQNKKKECAG